MSPIASTSYRPPTTDGYQRALPLPEHFVVRSSKSADTFERLSPDGPLRTSPLGNVPMADEETPWCDDMFLLLNERESVWRRAWVFLTGCFRDDSRSYKKLA